MTTTEISDSSPRRTTHSVPVRDPEFSAPDHLSLRARIITRLVRWGVRYWPRGDPSKLALRARQMFELPNVLGFMFSRGMEIELVNMKGICGEWISAPQRETDNSVLLFLHGGGYVSCSARSHRSISASLARLLPGRVFSANYRLAPEHPFPAAVDDAVAAYLWLLDHEIPPAKIAVAGDSAGGGLAIAMLVRLQGLGKPLPSCVVCLSPWVDLSGASKYSNGSSSSVFNAGEVSSLAALYLQGRPPEDPEASPVFADLTGLPPLLIHAARTELLADDAIRLDQRARTCGVDSTLVLYPDLPHVWQIYAGLLPEARLALQQAATFIRKHLTNRERAKT